MTEESGAFASESESSSKPPLDRGGKKPAKWKVHGFAGQSGPSSSPHCAEKRRVWAGSR